MKSLDCLHTYLSSQLNFQHALNDWPCFFSDGNLFRESEFEKGRFGFMGEGYHSTNGDLSGKKEWYCLASGGYLMDFFDLIPEDC